MRVKSKTYFLKLICLAIAVVFCGCASKSDENTGIKNVLISAHRAGPTVGFPENALETIKNTSKGIPEVMLEIDVRSTKDGVLVLLHDETLDRTTTLKGYLKDYTFKELKSGFLLNKDSVPTNMKIPTLTEVLNWTKNNQAYLSIDVKDKSIFHLIIDLIREHQIGNKAEIITYSIKDAELIHQYDPEIYISASIGSQEVLSKYLKSNINTSKIASYSGSTIKDPQFYKELKKNNITVTLGTMGNLDNKAKVKGFHLFKEWKKLGIHRFATDYPLEVYKIFNN